MTERTHVPRRPCFRDDDDDNDADDAQSTHGHWAATIYYPLPGF